MAVHDCSVRLQPAGALQPIVHRRRRPRAPAIHGPPSRCLDLWERFLGVLIEHYGGRSRRGCPGAGDRGPNADRHHDYAFEVEAELARAGVRVETDAGNERMNAKIRSAQMRKVPYMLVVGDREAAASSAAVRLRSGENLGAMPVSEIAARIEAEVREAG